MLSIILLALSVATIPAAGPSADEPPTTLRLTEGTEADGAATPQWLAMLRRRLPAQEYEAVAPIRRPLTPDERAWARTIEARLPGWERETPALIELFAPVDVPPTVTIVMGNRGAEDAFTHDPTTIGFDLAALMREYGRADGAGNLDRLDRFFRHEYVHLLQKARLAGRPEPTDTPLRRAFLEMWGEGLGNYFSLSERWRGGRGGPSSRAVETLGVLEPRLVARLSALVCASPAREAAITADLSWGRFDRKWGALPVALWLDAETRESPDALRRFVQAGPSGVAALAARRLPAALRPVLDDALQLETRCAAAGSAGPREARRPAGRAPVHAASAAGWRR